VEAHPTSTTTSRFHSAIFAGLALRGFPQGDWTLRELNCKDMTRTLG